MWDRNKHFERCIIQALETYQQILMNSTLSSDENDACYHDLYTKLKNEQWKEENRNIDDFPYKQLHEVRVSPEENPRYGVIVVLEDENGKNVVLDGNHRVNTMKELQDPSNFPVLFVSGFIP